MSENISAGTSPVSGGGLTKDDWVRFINETVEQHPAQTNKFQKMALCKMFVSGDQYKGYDETDNTVFDAEVTRETRCIYNIIRPFLDLYVAKMFEGDPVPAPQQHDGNTETVDLDVVKVVDPLISWWWSTEDMAHKVESAVRWGATTGLGPLKLYYDKDGGQLVQFDEDAATQMGVELEATEARMGRFVVEIVSPHKEYFPDPIATKDDDRRFCIHRYAVAKALAEDIFGKRRGYFECDQVADQQSWEEEATISADTYESDTGSEASDQVFVKELWWKPDKKNPRGKHIIVVNDEAVLFEDNETGNLDGGSRLPIYTVKIKGQADEYYGDGLVYPSTTLQRDFNKAHSTIMENLEWTGFNKPLVHEQANIDKNGWTDNSMDYIKWSGEHEPKYLQAYPLPDYINNRPNQIFNTMQILWGLPNVDMGAIPERGSQTSGIVVEELKESSSMSHSAEIRAIKRFIRRIVFDFLQMVQEFWDVERVVKVVGDNKRAEVEKFMEADLTPFSVDIDIKIGEGFGTSQAKKLQDIISLASLPPDADGSRVFSNQQIRDAIYNNANIEMIIEDTMLDEKKAKRNLDKILDDEGELIVDMEGQFSGVALDPEESEIIREQELMASEKNIAQLMSKFDNHEVHIKFFTDFTKKPEWEALPQEKKWAIDHYIEVAYLNMTAAMGLQAGVPPASAVPGQQGPTPESSYQQTQNEAQGHMATGFPQGQTIPPEQF